MPARTDRDKSKLIEKIVALARGKVEPGKADEAEAFIRVYYANVPPDDIADATPENLCGAALALLSFGRSRAGGAAKVRAFNPRFEEHGWSSSHTVIEAVTDDMPFLVDSLTGELNRMDLTVHLVVHPTVHVRRDAKGAAEALGSGAANARAESFIHAEVDEQADPDMIETIRAGIERVFADVRLAVTDWRAMRAKAADILAKIDGVPLPKDEIGAGGTFLEWLDANNFTYLGYRDYTLDGDNSDARFKVVEGSGLGVLRDPAVSVYDDANEAATLPPEVRDFLRQPKLLRIAKADHRSRIHRRSLMDVIAVKSFDAKGAVAGERMILGLFTSAAYSQSPRDIPLLREKLEAVMRRSGFTPGSHDGKALLHILETFPRDELFQIGEDDLFGMALGILHLQERQRTALFVRRDPFERFLSCLVFCPRDRYTTELRRRFETILEAAFNGKVTAFQPFLSEESVLARIHFIVRTRRGAIPDYRIEDIEARLVEAGRSWTDALKDALVAAKGERAGLALFRRYGEAFSAAYRDCFAVAAAIHDIDRVEEALTQGRLAMSLYRPVEAAENALRFKIFHGHGAVHLSDILPMLEHMGLRVVEETPYPVTPQGAAEPVWMHDFSLLSRTGGGIDIGVAKADFQEAFARIWSGELEDDGFNRLVLLAHLNWREVTILRAYCKYLRQAGIAFSQTYMEDTLANNPELARLLVEIFRVRFTPGKDTSERLAAAEMEAEFLKKLDAVSNLDEDRILRRFLNVLQATLRTNFFQTTANAPKPYLSFKLDSLAVEELPLPRPRYEIFVYSPRVEAIHLRGGKVARGGIRWSDRREDFRTEVLGLMKAQMVKNAVIVPMGSKGGFVVKRPPTEGGRDALQAEVVECYKTLIRGLLDLTDNLKGDKVVPPADVVRRDDDDTYLVVAADKGTATFSDIANGVSREYGFWLDDAFASGGSAGYDHKKMGITARGAWESVKRHFRELGVDVQSTAFTVAGVGDMSGDVFGNGLLRSSHTKLVAAFDHRHIFIDPDPDPAASLKERERLFKLPRSSWADYDKAALSPGGSIIDRKAKSVAVTPVVAKLLDIKAETITPAALMQAILRAKVDLLWFGGIGTYVKASTESAAEAGDRANDSIRVNGREIRARVVGEGANLGVTQRGRIEYARAGGRINTDAIDNSAGVDTSDHEVNIKILLGEVVGRGDLTLKQRNDLLTSMTDEVAALVLRDNYLQTQAISVAEAQGHRSIDQYARLMRALERAGKLNRAIEFLPDDEGLAERQNSGTGLTRPELAVLLAYGKMSLHDELLPSDLPDDALLVEDLLRYFPKALKAKHRDAAERHRLRREIIATVVTNSMVNRVGPAFVNEMRERTGRSANEIARAYAVTRDVFDLRKIWTAIEGLDNMVPAKTQTDMLLAVSRLVDRATSWFLRNGTHPIDIAAYVAEFGPGVAAIAQALPKMLAAERREALARRTEAYASAGVPQVLAERVAGLRDLPASGTIVRLSRGGAFDVQTVGRVHFGVGARLGIDWLRGAAQRLDPATAWQKLAVGAVLDDLVALQSEIAKKVLAAVDAAAADKASAGLEAWLAPRRAAVDRFEETLSEIRAANAVDLAMLTVATRELRALATV